MSETSSLPGGFQVQGYFIPAVGLGTFQGENGNSLVKETVIAALRQGYRHIDTAAAYGNEKEVGDAIKDSGVARNEIFVTTKLAQTWHDPEHVEEALDRSLRDLKLDYAHQPLGGRPVAVVNPNADRSGPLQDSTIQSIAIQYEKSPAQILLSWAVQRGTSVVPKTVQASRLEENKQLSRLDDTVMNTINQLAETNGQIRFLDPRNHIGFDIFDESEDQPTE
ncbi:MAG: hypothetical protein Q9195_004730 [Heterodermia aff. obscurata]